MTERIAVAMPFVVLGAACVVAGGLVSAVIAPAPSVHGAWAVAYLVLVAGVAQVALGGGLAALAPEPPSRQGVAVRVAVWNVGNAVVLAGTLTGVTPVVDGGGAVLVVGLVLLVAGVRGAANRGKRWPLYAFRALVILLLVSVPAGLVLVRVGPS